MTESLTANRRFGYARVSTYGQTLDAQLERCRIRFVPSLPGAKRRGNPCGRRRPFLPADDLTTIDGFASLAMTGHLKRRMLQTG